TRRDRQRRRSEQRARHDRADRARRKAETRKVIGQKHADEPIGESAQRAREEKAPGIGGRARGQHQPNATRRRPRSPPPPTTTTTLRRNFQNTSAPNATAASTTVHGSKRPSGKTATRASTIDTEIMTPTTPAVMPARNSLARPDARRSRCGA